MTDERIYDRDRMFQLPVFPTKQTPSYADWALYEMGKELEDSIGSMGSGDWTIVQPEDYASLLSSNKTVKDMYYTFTRAVQETYPDGTQQLSVYSSRLFIPKGYSHRTAGSIYTGLVYTYSTATFDSDQQLTRASLITEQVFARWRGMFMADGTVTKPYVYRHGINDVNGVMTTYSTQGTSIEGTMDFQNVTDLDFSPSEEGYYRIVMARG